MSDQIPVQTALLILGMHRSGTSLVTGVLHHLGLYLGTELLPPQDDNPKGFFENQAIVDLHDEILKSLGTSWDDPRGMPPGWLETPELAPFKERLRDLVAREFAGQPQFGVKDPRLCLLLPLWRVILQDMGIATKFLIVGRHPNEVMNSLCSREDMPTLQVAMLWAGYYIAAERACRGEPRSVVMYDDMLSDWRAEARRLNMEMRLKLAAPEDAPALLDGFVEPAMRHHDNIDAPVLEPLLRSEITALYQSLLYWRRTGVLRKAVWDEAAQEIPYMVNVAAPISHYLILRGHRERDTALHDLREALTPQEPVPNIYLAESMRRDATLLAERLQQINALQAELLGLHASVSWRVTQPLRALIDWWRGLVGQHRPD